MYAGHREKYFSMWFIFIFLSSEVFSKILVHGVKIQNSLEAKLMIKMKESGF